MTKQMKTLALYYLMTQFLIKTIYNNQMAVMCMLQAKVAADYSLILW